MALFMIILEVKKRQGLKTIKILQKMVMKFMTKSVFFIFFGFLFLNASAVQDSIRQKIPIMVLKNKQIKDVTDSLTFNTKGTNKSNVVLLSICDFKGCQFLFSGCVNRGFLHLLIMEPEFQSQQIVGFINISGYDCFVFGDHSTKHFFRQTKDSILIPEKFEWISKVSNAQFTDDLLNLIGYKTDPNAPFYITFDIHRFIYRRGKLVDIKSFPEFEDYFFDFRNEYRLPYRNE